jgi:N-acyl-D-aspartate/D-glutamate deacylase
MDNLLPPWMHDGGIDRLLERIADRPTRRKVVEECLIDGERWRTHMGAVGFDQIFVATCSRPELEGQSLAQLARQTGDTPAEAMLNLVERERATVSMVVFSQSEDNVAKVLAHPAVMVGSDSLGLSAGPGPHPGKPHPRMYGTFPRVLGRYVREVKLLKLEEAIRKMTSFPADFVGLTDRGRLVAGKAADITVFDPNTIADRSTWDKPKELAQGVRHVIVNGIVVLRDGKLTGQAPGKFLKRQR